MDLSFQPKVKSRGTHYYVVLLQPCDCCGKSIYLLEDGTWDQCLGKAKTFLEPPDLDQFDRECKIVPVQYTEYEPVSPAQMQDMFEYMRRFAHRNDN